MRQEKTILNDLEKAIATGRKASYNIAKFVVELNNGYETKGGEWTLKKISEVYDVQDINNLSTAFKFVENIDGFDTSLFSAVKIASIRKILKPEDISAAKVHELLKLTVSKLREMATTPATTTTTEEATTTTTEADTPAKEEEDTTATKEENTIMMTDEDGNVYDIPASIASKYLRK